MASHYQKDEGSNGEGSASYANGGLSKHTGMDDFNINYGTHTQRLDGIRQSYAAADGAGAAAGVKVVNTARDRRVASVSSHPLEGSERPVISPVSKRRDLLGGRAEKRLSMPPLTLLAHQEGNLVLVPQHQNIESQEKGGGKHPLAAGSPAVHQGEGCKDSAEEAVGVDNDPGADASGYASSQSAFSLEDNAVTITACDNQPTNDDRTTENEMGTPDDMNLPPEENVLGTSQPESSETRAAREPSGGPDPPREGPPSGVAEESRPTLYDVEVSNSSEENESRHTGEAASKHRRPSTETGPVIDTGETSTGSPEGKMFDTLYTLSHPSILLYFLYK